MSNVAEEQRKKIEELVEMVTSRLSRKFPSLTGRLVSYVIASVSEIGGDYDAKLIFTMSLDGHGFLSIVHGSLSWGLLNAPSFFMKRAFACLPELEDACEKYVMGTAHEFETMVEDIEEFLHNEDDDA